LRTAGRAGSGILPSPTSRSAAAAAPVSATAPALRSARRPRSRAAANSPWRTRPTATCSGAERARGQQNIAVGLDQPGEFAAALERERRADRSAGAVAETGAAAAAERLVGLGKIPEPARPAVRSAVDQHPVLALHRFADFQAEPRRRDFFLRAFGLRVGAPFGAAVFVLL